MENDRFRGVVVAMVTSLETAGDDVEVAEALLEPAFGFQTVVVDSPSLDQLSEVEVK